MKKISSKISHKNLEIFYPRGLKMVLEILKSRGNIFETRRGPLEIEITPRGSNSSKTNFTPRGKFKKPREFFSLEVPRYNFYLKKSIQLFEKYVLQFYFILMSFNIKFSLNKLIGFIKIRWFCRHFKRKYLCER